MGKVTEFTTLHFKKDHWESAGESTERARLEVQSLVAQDIATLFPTIANSSTPQLPVLEVKLPVIPEAILLKLRKAEQVTEEASGHKCWLFQQVDKPYIIYVIGTWATFIAHSYFLISDAGKEMLELFQRQPEIHRTETVHLGFDIFEHIDEQDSWMAAGSLCYQRWCVPREHKNQVAMALDPLLRAERASGSRVVGGWMYETDPHRGPTGCYEFMIFFAAEDVILKLLTPAITKFASQEFMLYDIHFVLEKTEVKRIQSLQISDSVAQEDNTSGSEY
ncbi:hypothetical protein VTL71DRAFT_15038 [Oculimacula yallundae]|uniref:Uncharacterized protein n=1 Tax=Oculimacula yallundae TaxID=86028 RepID=A0ABR4CFG0_9HELO